MLIHKNRLHVNPLYFFFSAAENSLKKRFLLGLGFFHAWDQRLWLLSKRLKILSLLLNIVRRQFNWCASLHASLVSSMWGLSLPANVLSWLRLSILSEIVDIRVLSILELVQDKLLRVIFKYFNLL